MNGCTEIYQVMPRDIVFISPGHALPWIMVNRPVKDRRRAAKDNWILTTRRQIGETEMKKRQLIGLLESRATFMDLSRGVPRKKAEPAPMGFGSDGRYEIKRKLGQGATGVVYQVWDSYIKRHVAVKVSERKSNRFMTEAQSAGRLKHPNIVSIHDVNLDGDFCYITMEYVEGPTLVEFCRPDNLLSLRRVVEIVLNVCNALDYAHGSGVIHRDIKPSNIMLDNEGNAKITDFGTAQVAERTMPFGIFGTPGYMSPEQLKDETLTKRSDIFSLGCVLYELLLGKQAFKGDNCFATIYRVINKEPTPISKVRPEVPRILTRIVEKAMSKDPEKRYETCVDFAHDLRVALRGLNGMGKGVKAKGFVDYVHRLPFFVPFTRTQVKGLIAASSIIKVRGKKVILAEGEISDTFYVVLSGRVKVRKDNHDIAAIEAGECFGEMACIGVQTRVADVVADTDCILMKIRVTLLDRSSESIQLIFYKTFAMTLVRRLSKSQKQEPPQTVAAGSENGRAA